MSQHIITVHYRGEPLEIQLGWDAPMRRHYVTVSVPDVVPLEEDDDGIRYSNLLDSKNDGSLAYQVDVLRRFGFLPRRALVEAIEDDARLGRMNTRREWKPIDALIPCLASHIQ